MRTFRLYSFVKIVALPNCGHVALSNERFRAVKRFYSFGRLFFGECVTRKNIRNSLQRIRENSKMLCKWLQQNAVHALGPGCNWSTIEYYREIWICCIPCHTCDQQGFYDDNDDSGDDLTGSSAKVGIILPYDDDDGDDDGDGDGDGDNLAGNLVKVTIMWPEKMQLFHSVVGVASLRGGLLLNNHQHQPR